MQHKYLRYLLVICLVTGSLLSSSVVLAQTTKKDPYEKFNRAMFTFNEKLDKYILKPVARVYNTVLPKPVNNSINRFFENLDDVPTVLNDVLQTNLYQATSDSWRFVINSTIGIGGLFDVASHIGLPDNSEDFGLTLAKWGYTKSNYLVLPFWGAKTLRDTLAMPINYITTPYFYLKNPKVSYGLYGLSVVNQRAQLLRFEKVYEQMALDRYIFVRNAYLQRRAYLIKRDTELKDPYTKQDKEPATSDNDFYYLDE